MAYIEVIFIAPDGRRFRAEIDEGADDKTLLSIVKRRMGLPTSTEDGSPITYRLDLEGGTRLRNGSSIRVKALGPIRSWERID